MRRDTNGLAIGVFGVHQDITRRRLLEDHLRQAQKMEAIGQLAGGVAHDFNNLLTAIVGFSELVLEHPGGDPSIRADVREVLKAATSAAALTQQLLAFSRRQTIDPQILDLSEIVGAIEGMTQRLIGEQVALVSSLSPSLWPVIADKGQIEQVVMNLAVNARDAMPTGGTLRIDTSNVELDEAFVIQHPGSAVGDYVRVAVSDTGIGMDATVQSHLFEPFFTTKAPGKGTGLGLATVYGIVRQSRGFIIVQTEVGRGSVFSVYLPKATGDISTSRTSDGPSELLGSETILIAEDQIEVRRVTHEVLERHGYHVLTAGDAAEALAILAQTPGVDLLLTDVVMPGMDGRELGRQVRILYPRINVLYMSGYTHVISNANGILEAGLDFLPKPFTTTALLKKVRSVLHGSMTTP